MKYKDLYRAAKREDFLEWLFNRKKYKIWELETMKVYNQNPEHHPEGYSVFDHVIAAVRDYKGSDPIVKLAILFHDIGKIDTAEHSPNGDYYHFMGMTRKVKKRFAGLRKNMYFLVM